MKTDAASALRDLKVRLVALFGAVARQAGADYLVTGDRAGYAAGPVPALAPAELLTPLPGGEEGPGARA